MKSIITALAIVFSTATAYASVPDLPNSDITDVDKLWLARAMVSESGFKAPRGHSILAWVLYRKWQKRKVNNPKLAFHSYIRRYCTEFGPNPGSVKRQRWVKRLPEDNETKPRGWPSREANWGVFKHHWTNVRLFVERWANGEIADACQGRATDWAAKFVKVDTRWFRRVSCGRTKNVYYRVRRGK